MSRESGGAEERELAKPFTHTYESIHPCTHSHNRHGKRSNRAHSDDGGWGRP